MYSWTRTHGTESTCTVEASGSLRLRCGKGAQLEKRDENGRPLCDIVETTSLNIDDPSKTQEDRSNNPLAGFLPRDRE